MKEKVQERINQVRKIATNTPSKKRENIPVSVRANDSLSKSIRNSKEAGIFLTELNAAIIVAKKRLS